jgi:hypothetical protein
MAYQWRNGRLMSDEEIDQDDRATWDALVYVGASVILPLALAYLGYVWGGKLTMLVGIGVGAWLTYAFYSPLVKIWRAVIVLGIVLGMVAVFVFMLQTLWNML